MFMIQDQGAMVGGGDTSIYRMSLGLVSKVLFGGSLNPRDCRLDKRRVSCFCCKSLQDPCRD